MDSLSQDRTRYLEAMNQWHYHCTTTPASLILIPETGPRNEAKPLLTALAVETALFPDPPVHVEGGSGPIGHLDPVYQGRGGVATHSSIGSRAHCMQVKQSKGEILCSACGMYMM